MIEFKEGRYYLGLWFVDAREEQDQDWMCAVWRDGDGKWEFAYRFRYHDPASTDPWDGLDRKSWSGGSIEEDPRPPEDETEGKFHLVAAQLAAKMGVGHVCYIPMHTDDQGKQWAALKRAPFIHLRKAGLDGALPIGQA